MTADSRYCHRVGADSRHSGAEVADEYRARYRTAGEIVAGGAIANLADGAEIRAHGLSTRLIAWPGTGYQTEAVHVVTVEPGEESERYAYDLAEQALLCFRGKGELLVRGRWVELEPGDIAYVPEGVETQIRNPSRNSSPFILVTQITPPQFDLYADRGLYNVELGVINFDSVHKATTNADPVPLSPDSELSYRDSHPEIRAWNLEAEDVRRNGALFNVEMGAEFTGIGIPMRLVLWPGHGCRLAGFNYAIAPDGVADVIHKHPVSDECLVMWSGRGAFFMGDRWIDASANDCLLAPCGVAHGHRSDGLIHVGGFASPPQLDLVLPSDYYESGRYKSPEPTRLER